MSEILAFLQSKFELLTDFHLAEVDDGHFKLSLRGMARSTTKPEEGSGGEDRRDSFWYTIVGDFIYIERVEATVSFPARRA